MNWMKLFFRMLLNLKEKNSRNVEFTMLYGLFRHPSLHWLLYQALGFISSHIFECHLEPSKIVISCLNNTRKESVSKWHNIDLETNLSLNGYNRHWTLPYVTWENGKSEKTSKLWPALWIFMGLSRQKLHNRHSGSFISRSVLPSSGQNLQIIEE